MKAAPVLALLLLAARVQAVAALAPPAAASARPTPPTRPADGPGAPHWTVMDAGINPPVDRNGDFEVGPGYIEPPPGGRDAQGSERGLEYDILSGKYAEFVEHEVMPQVESHYHLELTRDPSGRAALGCSSGAANADGSSTVALARLRVPRHEGSAS